MQGAISFGRRPLHIADYSRWVIIPKAVYSNLGIDVGDELEWVRYDDGRWGIIPIRKDKESAKSKEKEKDKAV